ncbi:MAG: Uma2 family endonuclease [Blastocatellia bacterium]
MQLLSEPRVHDWSRGEYYRMAKAGLFEGKHVELIEGQVIEMSPMGSLHATAVALAGRALENAFGPTFFARWQMPLDAGELSEPEPDVAIIQGDVRDFKDSHPGMAVLVVEVAETSLTYDRTIKASLYAKIGVPDYWILNLVERRIEVHRNSVAKTSSPFGFGYAAVEVFADGDFISPLICPEVRLAVADFLP